MLEALYQCITPNEIMDSHHIPQQPTHATRQDAYLKLIPEPMDLGTMRQKSKTPGAYPTFAAFDRDATLVFDNCMAFNAPGTPFHSGADKMKRQWGKFKEKFGGVDLKVAADRTKVRSSVCV